MNCRRWMALAAVLLVPGCSAWRTTPSLPVAQTIVLDQLVIYSDFAVPKKHRLLGEIRAMRGRLSAELGLPKSDEPIHVYLFKTPRRYRTFIQKHYPQFPDRRAFFVETDTTLAIYAFWGDRVAEDLRHEVAHGYLHAAVEDPSLWVDEGLAEYFEVARDKQGLNTDHLRRLAQQIDEANWRPDLSRMTQLKSTEAMQQLDYAEAWAWIHFLLETTPQRRELLRDYLNDLAKHRGGDELSQRVLAQDPTAADRLKAHVRSLAKSIDDS